MKKIIFFILFTNMAYGGVWSSLSASGFNQAYAQLNNFVSKENEYIKKYWKNEIEPILEKIKEEKKLEKEKNKIIEALNEDILLNQKEIEFLIKKHNELLNNEANILSNR